MEIGDIITDIQSNFISRVEIALLDGGFNLRYSTDEFPKELLYSYSENILSNLKVIPYGYIIPDRKIGFAVWKMRDFYICLYTHDKVGVLLFFEQIKNKYEQNLRNILFGISQPTVSTPQDGIQGTLIPPPGSSVTPDVLAKAVPTPAITPPPGSSVTPDVLAKAVPTPAITSPPATVSHEVHKTISSGIVETSAVKPTELFSKLSPEMPKAPPTVSPAPEYTAQPRIVALPQTQTPSIEPIAKKTSFMPSVAEILGDLLKPTEEKSAQPQLPQKEVKASPGGISISSVARSVSPQPSIPPKPVPAGEEGPKITIVTNPLDLIVPKQTPPTIVSGTKKDEEKSKLVIDKLDTILRGPPVSKTIGTSVKKAYPIAKKEIERARSLGLLDPDTELITKYCDGKHTIEDIASNIGRPVDFVSQKIKNLQQSGLVNIVYK
ncbi:MAG: hypothetical protein QXL15_00155 [Candidatus Korarchaeota archaeon]